MSVLLWLACQSPEVYTITVGRPTRQAPEDTGPPPEEQVSSELPPSDLTAVDIENQINTLMGFGVVEPVLARDSYLWLQSQGDLECPGDSPFQLMGIIEPCTSDSGYTYSGITIMRGGTGPLAFPDSFTLLADCYIIDPDGNRFVGAGELKYQSWGDVATGGIGVTSEGIWSYPNAEGWVGVDNSVWLDAIASWRDGGSEWYVKLDGATTLNGTSVYYDEVYVSHDCLGGWGLIQLRGEHGYWYDLPLKGDCSGCAEVGYGSTTLGEACLNTAELGRTFFDAYQPELPD